MLKNIDGIHNEKVMRRDHLVFAVVLVAVSTLLFFIACQKILKIVI